MKSRIIAPLGLVFVCATAVLAGCAGKASSARPGPSPTVTHAAATAVPSPLVSYAAYSDPLIKTTLSEANGILNLLKAGEKKNADLSTLGDQCAMMGGDISGSRQAVVAAYVPGAATIQKQILAGYKLVLGATDECGSAADALDHKQVKAAASDLYTGMKELSGVEASLSTWRSNKA